MSEYAQQLTTLLTERIRSAGIGGLTTAQDVRIFETLVIEAVASLEARSRGSRIFAQQLDGGLPDPAGGLEGDLFVVIDTGDLFVYVDGVWGLLFNLMPRTSAFAPVAQNAYGTHPGFNTEREWLIWLTQHLGSGTVPSPAPTITGFLPMTGARGSTVVLTGTGFTGATVVSINSGAVASFNVDSATQITAVLSTTQTTGKARVTVPGAGTAVSAADFTVVTTTALPVPANRQAIPISATELSVTASLVTNATGYKLYRSDTSTGTFTQIGGTLATPAYSDTGRTAATVYYYKWLAVGGGAYTDSVLSAAFAGTSAANSLTAYTPAAGMWHDTVVGEARPVIGSRRSSFAGLHYYTEATQMEVELISDVFGNNPDSCLNLFLNGDTASPTAIHATAASVVQRVAVSVAPGAKNYELLEGYQAMPDDVNVLGCYALKIWANAPVTFIAPVAPAHREIVEGDSLSVANAMLSWTILRRRSNASNRRITVDGWGYRAMSQRYKTTDDRAAQDAQIVAMADGTASNTYMPGLCVNDAARSTPEQYGERIRARWDRLHALLPDMIFRPIVPQIRNDASAADQIPYAAEFVAAILERSWIKLSYFQLLSIANLQIPPTDGIHPLALGSQEMHDNMRLQEAYTGFRAPRAIDSANQNEANFSGGNWDPQTHPVFLDGTAYSTSDSGAGITIQAKVYCRYIGICYLTGPDSGTANLVINGSIVDTWSELDAPGTTYLSAIRWYDTGAYAEHAALTIEYRSAGTGVINYDGIWLK